MLASQENPSDSESLVVADTMLELSTEVIAHNPPKQQLPNPSPSPVWIIKTRYGALLHGYTYSDINALQDRRKTHLIS